jgi:hypothetical protein
MASSFWWKFHKVQAIGAGKVLAVFLEEHLNTF